MTLNLLVTVPEGMVLLADSMLTLPTAEITNYQHAEKLITLGRDHTPAAAMISGAGSVNGKLVSILLRKAGAQVDALPSTTHQQVVDIVVNLIDPEYDQWIHAIRIDAAARSSEFDELTKINDERATKHNLRPLPQIEPRHISIPDRNDNDPDAFLVVAAPVLTIVVATYFDDDPKATEIWWPTKTIKPAAIPLGWWGSGITAVQRLTMGYDFFKLQAKAQEEAMAASTTSTGAPVDDAQRAFAYMNSQQLDFVMGIPFDALPLQDAIDLTEFLGKVACGFDQFSIGAARVGGPLDVLVLISNQRKWIKVKQIHSSL